MCAVLSYELSVCFSQAQCLVFLDVLDFRLLCSLPSKSQSWVFIMVNSVIKVRKVIPFMLMKHHLMYTCEGMEVGPTHF